MFTKTIAAVLIAAVALIALPKPTAYAGDKEWATAGKILAGVVGAAIIHEAVTSNNRTATVVRTEYRGEPVRRVRYVQSPPRRQWVPGHYVARTERHWVDGWYEQVWIPAEYKQVRVIHRDRWGRTSTTWKQVLVCEGHYEKVWHEGYWETRQVREWVPGCWADEPGGGPGYNHAPRVGHDRGDDRGYDGGRGPGDGRRHR